MSACLSKISLSGGNDIFIENQQRRFVQPGQFDDAEDDKMKNHRMQQQVMMIQQNSSPRIHYLSQSRRFEASSVLQAPPIVAIKQMHLHVPTTRTEERIMSSSYLMDVVRADIREHAHAVASESSSLPSFPATYTIASFERRRPPKKRFISISSSAEELEMTVAPKPVIKKKRGPSRPLGVYKRQWFMSYQELVAFYQIKGHCRVPQNYSSNPTLGTWVHNQRRKFKLGVMADERIKLLERLNFQWEISRGGERLDYPACPKWETMFSKLCAFKNKYGHCEVNMIGTDATPQLSEWFQTQLYWYERFISGISQTKMTEARAAKLECVGISLAKQQRK